ncbi:MAG: hypothetical protein Q9M22_04325 [Mariprofundaceae bacterium]|nr:hypothetical protein [Mariprofundaceae bacterium]
MKKRSIITTLIIAMSSLMLASLSYAECIINMTYKEGDKLPLIAKSPDNSGAYLALFSQAATRIGCTLHVTRLSKKRLHKMLAEGTLDFYPGASFSKKRSTYLFYIENGFSTGEYGITSLQQSEIMRYEDLKGRDLTWVLELNSSKHELAQSLNIHFQQRKYLNLDVVHKLIAGKRSVFYVADKELVDYYPKRSGLSSLKAAGMKVHKNCCGGEVPMYLGFSRYSKHFKERKNPGYDAKLAISPTNFPTELDPQSVAYKFSQALRSLKESGETKKIHTQYFH